MTNLTLSLDDAVVRQARVRAIEQGTSLSAKIREFLQQYAKGDEPTAPSPVAQTQQLMALMNQVRQEAQVPLKRPQAKLRSEIYEDNLRGKPKRAI